MRGFCADKFTGSSGRWRFQVKCMDKRLTAVKNYKGLDGWGEEKESRNPQAIRAYCHDVKVKCGAGGRAKVTGPLEALYLLERPWSQTWCRSPLWNMWWWSLQNGGVQAGVLQNTGNRRKSPGGKKILGESVCGNRKLISTSQGSVCHQHACCFEKEDIGAAA